MTSQPISPEDETPVQPTLAEVLFKLPAGPRGGLLQVVASFHPSPTIEESFELGPLRAAFAQHWELITGKPVPIASLRLVLWPPVRLETSLLFHQLATAKTVAEIEAVLAEVFDHLVRQIEQIWTAAQAPPNPSRAKTQPAAPDRPADRAVSSQSNLNSPGDSAGTSGKKKVLGRGERRLGSHSHVRRQRKDKKAHVRKKRP